MDGLDLDTRGVKVDHGLMGPSATAWVALPGPARAAVTGAVVAGGAGGIVGLILGVTTYVPTTPFAIVEVGLPAAVVGAVIGLTAGLVSRAARRGIAQRRR